VPPTRTTIGVSILSLSHALDADTVPLAVPVCAANTPSMIVPLAPNHDAAPSLPSTSDNR